MWYEYRCDCGLVHEYQAFERIGSTLPGVSCSCGGDLIRIVSVPNVTPQQDGYFNHTVGQFVTSTKDFERKLKDGQRRMSERLGYEQSFTPVYPSERKSYVESHASDGPDKGESVEKYGRIYNKVNEKRTIIT